MKLSKRLMALALTGAMALGVSAGAVSFPDVDETTPEGEAIIKLAEMGVLGGFEDGTFKPEATVTRAQFAKIIYLLQNPGTEDILGDAYKGPSKFPDVLEEQWFNGYVNWAVAEGIIGGYDDGTFKPDATLTMGQAIKMSVTANGTPADGIEYPQGFIDIAEEKGYLENVADFTGNDTAPRGPIALVGANPLADEPAGDPTQAEDGTYTSVITKVDGNVLTFAPADEKGRGSIIDATAETVTPTDPPKGVKTVFSADQTKLTYADATDAKVTVVDGTIDSDATGAAGTRADIKASDSENFYAAELTVEGGKVTEITLSLIHI